MDILAWERGEDDYDLLLLNCYVLLDALRRENAALRRRIFAHWQTFQRLREGFGEAT